MTVGIVGGIIVVNVIALVVDVPTRGTMVGCRGVEGKMVAIGLIKDAREVASISAVNTAALVGCRVATGVGCIKVLFKSCALRLVVKLSMVDRGACGARLSVALEGNVEVVGSMTTV